ncbi:MAG TPA: Uma2 family endonuclease [Ktedonobacterales bacterium]|jgi:Uma2 family endonuclease
MAIEPYTEPYTIIPGRRISAAEYATITDKPGWRSELDMGRIILMPTVKDPLHDWIIDNLVRRLSPYVAERKLGGLTYEQVGYNITQPDDPEESVWMPDLAFVSKNNAQRVLEARKKGDYPRLAPDLVVEVVSPSQSKADMTERAHRWLAAGTRLIWAIWPATKTVDVWQPDDPTRTLKAREQLDGLEVVPGFALAVADLFTLPFGK